MTDADSEDDTISKEEWAQRRLEEVAMGSTTSPVEGAKQSLGNYRRMLQLDNTLVFITNIAFLAIGAGLVMRGGQGFVPLLGWASLLIGALGIADTILGRLWMWYQ